MNPAEYKALSENEERLWWFRGMRRMTDVFLDKHCSAGRGARILEAGCGTGYEAARFARERGWALTVVDLSPVAAGLARRRGLAPAIADIRVLPFRSGSFEGLISLDVLVHLESEGQSAAIEEFARVVAPGGWILLRVAALKALRSRHSEWVGERRRVRLGELRAKVEAAGLRVVRATYTNSLLLPVALMKFRIWEPLTRAPAASGVVLPAGWLNGLLELPLRMEAGWLRAGGWLPIGQSVWVVANKGA